MVGSERAESERIYAATERELKLEVMLHELSLPGVFLAKPTIHSDERGTFQEWFKASTFEQANWVSA